MPRSITVTARQETSGQGAYGIEVNVEEAAGGVLRLVLSGLDLARTGRDPTLGFALDGLPQRGRLIVSADGPAGVRLEAVARRGETVTDVAVTLTAPPATRGPWSAVFVLRHARRALFLDDLDLSGFVITPGEIGTGEVGMPAGRLVRIEPASPEDLPVMTYLQSHRIAIGGEVLGTLLLDQEGGAVFLSNDPLPVAGRRWRRSRRMRQRAPEFARPFEPRQARRLETRAALAALGLEAL